MNQEYLDDYEKVLDVYATTTVSAARIIEQQFSCVAFVCDLCLHRARTQPHPPSVPLQARWDLGGSLRVQLSETQRLGRRHRVAPQLERTVGRWQCPDQRDRQFNLVSVGVLDASACRVGFRDRAGVLDAIAADRRDRRARCS